MAMTAAETGHLVLGTLHTTSATKTIDRIIDALPTEEREQTKSFLASSLIAVITQVLLKTPDQRARRAVCEIMVLTKAIGKLIMTDQSHQIPSQLQMGKEYGMQLLDQALLAAINAKEVDPEHAYSYAVGQAPVPALRHRHERRPAGSEPAAHLIVAMPAIDAYLTQVLERDGSDLHFLAGDPARVRQYGELKPLSAEPLDAEMVKTTLYEIMPKLAVERFEAKDGTDFAYSIPGVARFRVNVMRQLNGMGAVFRAIPSKARTAEELKLPRGRAGSVQDQQRPDPGHRQDRLRQVHHARRHDR